MDLDVAVNQTSFYQYQPGGWAALKSPVIAEEPVSLTVNGRIWITFMCTPVDLEALAIGFLFNEGILESMDEISSVRVCPTGDNVDVWLSHGAKEPDRWRRTSGCTGGVTAVTMDPLEKQLVPEAGWNGFYLPPQKICKLVAQLYDRQDLYQQTGGVHTSALCNGEEIVLVAEDVGRHNTLDKLAGKALLERLTSPRPVVLTTGRISSEMLQKAARLGAVVVVSRTSPTSLSVQLAEKMGLTLVGYARRDRFRVYTHPVRISANTG